jgi:hypothetical protein
MKQRVAIAVVAVSVAASAAGAFAAAKPFSVVAVRTSATSTKTTSAFTENLLNGKKVVGTDSVKCKAVSKQTICTGVFTFKAGGTIKIDGALKSDGNDATFELAGGTGPYANARGTLKLAPTSATHTNVTFELS